MYILATEDLEYYIPWSGKNGGNTAVDVARMGTDGNVPRLFDDPTSAAIALGHWLSGPYDGVMEDDGWHSVQRTDPARRRVWGDKLKVRKVTIV